MVGHQLGGAGLQSFVTPISWFPNAMAVLWFGQRRYPSAHCRFYAICVFFHHYRAIPYLNPTKPTAGSSPLGGLAFVDGVLRLTEGDAKDFCRRKSRAAVLS